MVCSKCQRLLKATELATPNVKRKSEIYYGSSTSGSSSSNSKTSASTTKPNGIGKVRLCPLSSNFPNRSADDCRLRVSSYQKRPRIPTRPIRVLARHVRPGRIRDGSYVRGVHTRRMARFLFCIANLAYGCGANSGRIAYVACAMCGRSQSEKKKALGDAPVVQGQRFSAK